MPASPCLNLKLPDNHNHFELFGPDSRIFGYERLHNVAQGANHTNFFNRQ